LFIFVFFFVACFVLMFRRLPDVTQGGSSGASDVFRGKRSFCCSIPGVCGTRRPMFHEDERAVFVLCG
ncbi:hypothetical protein, partial [Escherichia coli]|uniref:hypothetical protein n=1 Tax=Escherichia coli TaxID=562 RepID=UPI00384DF3F5